MYEINQQNLIVDAEDNRPVAVFINSFVTAMGVGSESDNVIVRLHHDSWKQSGPLIPNNQVHQFLLTARRAGELGRHLLELAAQAEKEQGQTNH